MHHPNEGEPSPPLPWVEDDKSVEEALRDVVISHEGERDPEGDGGEDGDNGADGDSSRRRRGRAA
jgi:hypothetical protein